MKFTAAALACTLTCVSVSAQNIDDKDTFHPSSSQKTVRISSDVLALSLPLSAAIASVATRDWTGLKQFALTTATNAGVSIILKYAIKEDRPDRSNHHSFPSMHTSVSFSSAAFIQRRYGWKWGVTAYAAATYVGWARVYSKKHHYWDVLAGAAIGAASAYIYTRPFAKKLNLEISPAIIEPYPDAPHPHPALQTTITF